MRVCELSMTTAQTIFDFAISPYFLRTHPVLLPLEASSLTHVLLVPLKSHNNVRHPLHMLYTLISILSLGIELLIGTRTSIGSGFYP